MPRKKRFILPNIPHHTIQRGNNRQNIFYEPADYHYFLDQLYEQCEENAVEIGAYCLMTNHVHLLTYPETPEGMIKTMKLTCQRYTQYFNKKYKRTGKLWENRYKIHWIDPEREWVLARYIEKNPVKADMVDKAEFYTYSSARRNLLGMLDKYVSRDIVPAARRESYNEFFHEDDSREGESDQEIEMTAEQGKAYGGIDFISKLEASIGISVRLRARGRPKK